MLSTTISQSLTGYAPTGTGTNNANLIHVTNGRGTAASSWVGLKGKPNGR